MVSHGVPWCPILLSFKMIPDDQLLAQKDAALQVMVQAFSREADHGGHVAGGTSPGKSPDWTEVSLFEPWGRIKFNTEHSS